MRRLNMGRSLKRLVAGLVVLALVAGAAVLAFAAFGPDQVADQVADQVPDQVPDQLPEQVADQVPDRPTRAWSPTVRGFDYVSFNAFTGVPNIGDMRDFLRGVEVGRDTDWNDPVADVTQAAEIEVKILIENSADASLNDQPGNPGIARNVQVRVVLPTGTQQSHVATAYVSADNAQPREVFDTLTMTGADRGFFELAYVPGSARLHRGDTATALSDNLVADGVNIGDMRGGFQYVQEITFRMRVNMPRYTIAKQVTTPGSIDWRETLNANPGETVSWLITFRNVGRTELRNVKIVDEVPIALTVIPGTVRLVNGNHPDGFIFPDSAIQAGGRQINVDIGNYNPGALAYVTFRTRIADAQALRCGENSIPNRAFATPEGFGAIWEDANVVVDREC
jgi:uncharacterized repeat protein (TIGR01451 family)